MPGHSRGRCLAYAYYVTDVHDMLRFIDAAPSPYHAVAESVRRLEAAGFSGLDESASWRKDISGKRFVIRQGSVIAWCGDPRTAFAGTAFDAAGFRLVSAHTDSPNLRIKPPPAVTTGVMEGPGVELYGGVIANSWLDRDLGLSGQVGVLDNGMPTIRLFRDDRPILRIPQLAIHLDPELKQTGLKLSPQNHLQPVWAIRGTGPASFVEYLADLINCDPADVVSWNAMTHDINVGAVTGIANEFVASARLDNLVSCWAAITALIATADRHGHRDTPLPVVALFDHEEVGSLSASGANGNFLLHVLRRFEAAITGDHDALARAMSKSLLISADGAHATHPNYPERHDPNHTVLLNGGPVIKHNANVRYATDARGEAIVVAASRELGLPIQHFVSRNDVPCGSTIGPILAARLGVTTVDIGVPQLGMHSCREMCGVRDPVSLFHLIKAVFEGIPVL